MRMRRSVMAVVIALLITAMLAPAQAYAAPKVLKTTLYDGVIKSGYVVYVAGGEGLYKVWLNKNGSKKKSKLIHRYFSPQATAMCYGSMKKHGNYIYLNEYSSGSPTNLIRINVKTGKRKWLARNQNGTVNYAIYKNKIYYTCIPRKGGTFNGVMNLDGTKARRTSTRASARGWVSTTKGYYVRIIRKNKKITTYLKTPRGLYKLGSHSIW